MNNLKELQGNVEDLRALLLSAETDADNLRSEITKTDNRLKDLHKPVINEDMLEEIKHAVECAITEYNFSDSDKYEYDFQIDYDSKVNIDNIDFEEQDELSDRVSIAVEKLFNVIPD
jgi:hypothetical protein